MMAGIGFALGAGVGGAVDPPLQPAIKQTPNRREAKREEKARFIDSSLYETRRIWPTRKAKHHTYLTLLHKYFYEPAENIACRSRALWKFERHVTFSADLVTLDDGPV